ncbi:hypothetical protein [Amycolatopsis alkalitolerans]|uniref:Uncharacterized protein n=1 Tax=Amycolatopsis alkalitolerans TaxID=2547244 RepID=A0A5C4M4U1_9PSEU|nr:hypothetical protein [Amycolatopsis alkalitolerans]TNC26396.1 hypothetical protein FG385_11585 [Amycolatopsis alkalitolerans]
MTTLEAYNAAPERPFLGRGFELRVSHAPGPIQMNSTEESQFKLKRKEVRTKFAAFSDFGAQAERLEVSGASRS